MRHLQARQHLGKAIVVCDNPQAMLAVANKQWLKLARTLQRRRGFTANAVEILKYTYTITQMQHMTLVAELPDDAPEAVGYLLTPKQLRSLPGNSLSVYITTKIDDITLGRLMRELPNSALVVDYTGQIDPGDFGLRTKAELEARAAASWQTVVAFLAKYQIHMQQLTPTPRSPLPTDAVDDALDALIAVDREFLEVATLFQRSLDLARPLQGISKQQRDQYEAFVMLAHRLQALSRGGFSPQFLRTYGDDAFFMHDVFGTSEPLAETVARHRAAGRVRLAKALLQYYQGRGLRESSAMLGMGMAT
jgi:hypothetical protein